MNLRDQLRAAAMATALLAVAVIACVMWILYAGGSPAAFLVMAKAAMWRSLAVVAWFSLGAAVLLRVLRRPTPRRIFIWFAVFTVPDLLVYGHLAVVSTTSPREATAQVPVTPLAHNYQARRIPDFAWPGFYMPAALSRRFTAYHVSTPGGSHFFELKDAYDFARLPSQEVKDIAAGISADRLRVVGKAVVLDHASVWKAMEKAEPTLLRKVVFIEEDLPEEYQALVTTLERGSDEAEPSASIRVIRFTPDICIAQTMTEQDGLLYYSDGFDGPWRATIDGAQQHVYRADYAFKAVPLPRGAHEVRFEYRPRAYRVSLACYWAGILLAAAAMAATARRADA